MKRKINDKEENMNKLKTEENSIEEQKDLTIYTWNVKGIEEILKENKFANFMASRDKKPDILCLQEILIKEGKKEEIKAKLLQW